MRRLAAVFIVFIVPPLYALESASLTIGTIQAQGWKLEGVKIALAGLAQKNHKLILTVERLRFPRPFDDLQLADIRCEAFSWHDNEIDCERGRAKIHSRRWHSPDAGISFHIEENLVRFKISSLHLFEGAITVSVNAKDDRWHLEVGAKNLAIQQIQKGLRQDLAEIKQGRLAMNVHADGTRMRVNRFELAAGLTDLTGQTKDGKYAAEALSLSTRLNIQNDGSLWQWQSRSRMSGGAFYADPVYVDANGQEINVNTEGDWDINIKQAVLRFIDYRHTGSGELTGSAAVSVSDGFKLEKADFSLHSGNLEKLSTIYLNPFLEQTALEGVTLKGQLSADIAVVQQALTSLKLFFTDIAVKDAENRFGLDGGAGSVYWSTEERIPQRSLISWRQMKLRALPIGPAKLEFLVGADKIALLDKARLPFLEGDIAVNKFRWQKKAQQEPDVYFEGGINNVSLQKLSEALDWTPLSGVVSGHIPGIEYRNRTLKLGGDLNIDVFGGNVKITDLTSSGLFTDYPELTADIDIDNLDMEQITRKFQFGSITGRLSGFIKDLVLENWKPVSFYAWIGTPDNDHSRHRISQKAVKNIASIGGGGATDLLSRSFLSLFNTFGYDKLGIGCYLHSGVCQLMGVEAADNGYYIVKGGGLPRINVIGYNLQIDWNVLMDRLKRISTSNEIIVQ